MAEPTQLRKAYFKAGKASTKYKASLYDVEALGYQKEASASMYQFETTKRDRNLALISESIGLGSAVAGGYKDKQEFKKASSSVQEGIAKEAWGKSEAVKLKLDETYKSVDWGKLGTKSKATELAKFKPTQVKQGFFENIFGAEKEYTFGKGGDSFSKSEISAAGTTYDTDKLSSLIGMDITGLNKSSKSDNPEVVENNISSKDESAVSVDEIFSGNTGKVATADLTGGGSEKIIQDIQDSVKNIGKTKVKEPTLEDIALGKSSSPINFNFDMDFGNSMSAGSAKETKRFAKGGEFTTDGPEMILVGDNPGGKEKVKVTPMKSNDSKKLSDNIGSNLKDLVSKKGTKPGSNKWITEYITNQKINNESLRPLQGELSKHNKKLFSMAEESGYFGEFFRGGWE